MSLKAWRLQFPASLLGWLVNHSDQVGCIAIVSLLLFRIYSLIRSRGCCTVQCESKSKVGMRPLGFHSPRSKVKITSPIFNFRSACPCSLRSSICFQTRISDPHTKHTVLNMSIWFGCSMRVLLLHKSLSDDCKEQREQTQLYLIVTWAYRRSIPEIHP